MVTKSAVTRRGYEVYREKDDETEHLQKDKGLSQKQEKLLIVQYCVCARARVSICVDCIYGKEPVVVTVQKAWILIFNLKILDGISGRAVQGTFQYLNARFNISLTVCEFL
ncbi:hypothetical protein F2P56_003119 [Juglans regia]|uniref:Uncharacterized protein n=1 Tax=Juglans regia TaxID=51240 RepID=A0A833Y3K5_JUGRE|nr:hypothetical protein F2P56_003119 [Juglans regia]